MRRVSRRVIETDEVELSAYVAARGDIGIALRLRKVAVPLVERFAHDDVLLFHAVLVDFGVVPVPFGGIGEVAAPRHALLGFGSYHVDVVDVDVLLSESVKFGRRAIFFCDDFARQFSVADLDEQSRIFLDAPLAYLCADLIGEVEVFEVGAKADDDIVVRRSSLFCEQRLAQAEVELALVDVELKKVRDRRFGRQRQILVLLPLSERERVAIAEVGVVEIFVVLRIYAVEDGISDPLLFEPLVRMHEELVVGDRVEEDAPVRPAEADHHKAEVDFGAYRRAVELYLSVRHELGHGMSQGEAVRDQLIFVDIAQSAVSFFGEVSECRAIFGQTERICKKACFDVRSLVIELDDQLGQLLAQNDVARIVAGIDDDIDLFVGHVAHSRLDEPRKIFVVIQRDRRPLDKICGVSRLLGAVRHQHRSGVAPDRREQLDVVLVEPDDDIQLFRSPRTARADKVIHSLPEQRRGEKSRVDDDQHKTDLDDHGIKDVFRHQRRRARIVELEDDRVDARLDRHPQRPRGSLAVEHMRDQIERDRRKIDQDEFAFLETAQQFEPFAPILSIDDRHGGIDHHSDHIDQTQRRNDIDNCHNILPHTPRGARALFSFVCPFAGRSAPCARLRIPSNIPFGIYAAYFSVPRARLRRRA